MKNLPDGRTIAGGVADSGMAYSSVAGANLFDFAADVFYMPAEGADFIYTGDFPFTLTAEGCVLTYTGDEDRTVIISLAMSIVQVNAFGDDTRGVALALNGDLLGLGITNAAALAAGTMVVLMDPNGPAYPVATTRRVTLSPGDTIQPVCASTALNEEVTIQTMSLTVG